MIGRSLGHFRITAKLGEGGMGEVYRATDTHLGREVALKVLPAGMASSPDRLERFRREARALAALDHPGIVTVFSVEEAADVHFLTMQLVEGRTLDRLLVDGGLPLEAIFDLSIPLAEALAAAHDRGIVHRDLKPTNVMVAADGRIKILDFGLAKLEEPMLDASGTQLSTELLTQQGLVLGTLPYMSPEQAEGRELDHRSDVFSFGVMLFEMACGRRPFAGDSPAALVSSILKEAPPLVTQLEPELPRHLSRIIARCLEKDPADRYQSVRELYNELRGLRREVDSGVTLAPSPAAPTASSPTGAARKTVWTFAIAAVLALGLGALWMVRGREEPAREVSGGTAADAAEEQPRIVVLPFENLGPPEDQYFAAGMAEEITSRLSRVRGLGVISRKSAMSYAGSAKSTRQIGEELGVGYLLEGSIRWARTGDGVGRVRVTPQLIRVSDDTQVWSETHDRVIDDIFDVQAEIASEVIDALGITLLGSERGAVTAAPTDNVEAFNAYLRGTDYTIFWDHSNFERAILLFERAVELDPEFAVAWAELGKAHASIVHFGYDRSEARIRAARQAVERALELAPESPLSHQALGMYHYHAHKDYSRAEEAFAAADRLRPDLPEVLEGQGLVQRRQGRWEESTRSFERAVELSPRDENLLVNLGATYVFTARYPQALEALDRCLEVRPDAIWCQFYRWENFVAWDGATARARRVIDALPDSASDIWVHVRYEQAVLERDFERALAELENAEVILEGGAIHRPASLLEALAHYLKGDAERAREAFERTRQTLESELEQNPGYFEIRSSLGLAYAGLGRRDEAVREGLRALEEYPVSRDATWGPELIVEMARIYTMVGEPEAALEQLARVLSIPSEFSVGKLRLEPWADPLRDHPGYAELIRKHS